MHIFIDESGTFICAQRRHVISVVGALIIPDDTRTNVERKYAKLRPDLPTENGEVKGRRLSEAHVASVVSLLARHQVLFEVTAIDMGVHREADIVAHKTGQAERLTRSLTSDHHPNIHAGVWDLRHRLERMSNQLYVQSAVTFELIYRVIQHATMFYSQRKPRELAAFHWVIDGKDKTRVTDWEDWWSYVVRPLLQSRSLRDPLVMLREADYSHFERFGTTMGEHLRPHMPREENDDVADLTKLMTESFRFSSDPEPGLELVDILENATRRALMRTLDIRGWRDLRSLMIHRPQHYVQMVALLESTPLPRQWPYMLVLRHFSRGGKRMIAPRFSP